MCIFRRLRFQCQNNLKSAKQVYHVNLKLLIRQLALFSYAELNEKESSYFQKSLVCLNQKINLVNKIRITLVTFHCKPRVKEEKFVEPSHKKRFGQLGDYHKSNTIQQIYFTKSNNETPKTPISPNPSTQNPNNIKQTKRIESCIILKAYRPFPCL
jgi:hypothetical protein